LDSLSELFFSGGTKWHFVSVWLGSSSVYIKNCHCLHCKNCKNENTT